MVDNVRKIKTISFMLDIQDKMNWKNSLSKDIFPLKRLKTGKEVYRKTYPSFGLKSSSENKIRLDYNWLIVARTFKLAVGSRSMTYKIIQIGRKFEQTHAPRLANSI